MITRHPLGRQDLRIKRRDKVLEIGPGHDPMFRSDVIADKFPHDDTHRCGKVLIYPHQQFIEADGEQLPFEKDTFDYVICNQVLEHADNPADDYYSSFFTRKWNREMTMKIFPPRRGLTEINRTLQASYYLVREKLGQKIHKRPSPITLDEYLAEREK